jgi:hypothetical protein
MQHIDFKRENGSSKNGAFGLPNAAADGRSDFRMNKPPGPAFTEHETLAGMC